MHETAFDGSRRFQIFARATSDTVVGVCVECGRPMDEVRHVCAVLETPAARPDLRALLDAAVAHEARAAEARVRFRAGVEAEYLSGRTLRDIGAEVGLTFQRIHALTAPCRAGRGRARR